MKALLADQSIDAVYIANIHPAHLEWVTNAARAGKHILVEKPMGMNQSEVSSMIDAAYKRCLSYGNFYVSLSSADSEDG